MRIKNFIFKLKWLILIQVIFSFIAYVAISLIPVCNKYLVDYVFLNGGKHFFALMAVYLICYLVYLAAMWGSERFVWKSAITFENSLKKECFNVMLKMKYGFFSKRKSDEYLSILTNNVTSIEQDYLQPVCALIKSFISVIVYTVVISVCTSPLICAFLFALSIIASFTPGIYKKKLSTAGKAYVDEAAVYTKKISDLLDGFEMVDSVSDSAFSAENVSFTDFLSGKRHALGKAKVNGNTTSGAAVCLIDVVIFALCGIMLLKGYITAGTILAAITYSQAFTEPIQEILYDINTLNASKDIVVSLENMLNISDENLRHLSDVARADIALKDARVAFPEKILCYNARFLIGKKYLVTGESGRGKTTLLNAIAGRNEASDSVLIDGIERSLSEDECFYLSQHQHVFNDNFADNVTLFGAYPCPDALTENKLALKEKIQKASDCTTLSGGEQQILKLYRMLAQNKPILLLDEPFSSLDARNSKEAFQVLSHLPATIILISHNIEFEEADLMCWEKVNIEDICHEL